LSFVARSLVGEDDELNVNVAFVVVLQMGQLRMLLVLAYWLIFTNDQGSKFGRSILPPTAQAHPRQHKILCALVGIIKSKSKSFHDRMDALA
jgi:hypothetical protein